MPDEPLIFVEVALLPEMAAEIGPLLVSDATPEDASTFKTAVFYSISNCQPGLRGVSLGNFLIKQVVDVLTQEYQKLREFCTLSPIPGFRTWLKERMQHSFGDDKRTTPALRRALTNITQALHGDLSNQASELRTQTSGLTKHERDLSRLCAAYLLGIGEPGGTSRDPVARFHLNNGAQLQRLNVRADLSDKGLKQSLGMMVNYLYEPKRIERNHEQFVRGRTIASDDVEGLL
jgi:malonyl-CoA decarboxylase